VFLVPQRPYAVLGTLADQITYPAAIPKAERDEAKLQACLERVGIFYLVAQFEKEGGWDAEKTWEDVFSGGEMQRMGLARVFYHRPAFAVLDEW
jgi:ATP-binding cassette subfamily D (ALD) long-chain fatty acid import protein